VGFSVSLEDILGDPGFENWLVNRVLNELAMRGVRLPEYVVCELKRVSDGIRMRLIEVVELEDGDYGETGVFYEVNFNHHEMKYLYDEYRAEKAKAVRVLG
jgi:hypothetical protein